MVKLYTSRYQNPELKSGDYTPVGITLGRPKFKLGYDLFGNIYDIAPSKDLFGKGYPKEVYTKLYFEKMDRIGVDRVRRQLDKYRAFGKPVVLLCYEDLRDETLFCHRTCFAQWWEMRTGEKVEELHDTSVFKPKKSVTKDKNSEIKKEAKKAIIDDMLEEQMSLF